LPVRIAQIAPLTESIPPRLHGGKARVISYLTEELCELGHRVTLFASGDSLTQAQLVACAPRALPADAPQSAVDEAHARMLREVYLRRDRFDVIHLHLDGWHRLCPELLQCCHVTSVHGQALERSDELMHPDLRLIAVSEFQRSSLPQANWLATVRHGLPDGFCRPCHEPGSYLVFVGRIGPGTGVEQAIEIARRSGWPLRIAGRVERADGEFYRGLRKRLSQPGVEFLGELDEHRKDELLAGAYALLQPAEVPEPFGLAMIEAMQCGTPVIALRRGSVSELIEPGSSGFIVNDLAGAVACVARIRELDRSEVARVARHRFSARGMARSYLRWYARGIARELSGAIHMPSLAQPTAVQALYTELGSRADPAE
jgi:glycosyltransferase involved in cell wall biosynthesis